MAELTLQVSPDQWLLRAHYYMLRLWFSICVCSLEHDHLDCMHDVQRWKGQLFLKLPGLQLWAHRCWHRQIAGGEPPRLWPLCSTLSRLALPQPLNMKFKIMFWWSMLTDILKDWTVDWWLSPCLCNPRAHPIYMHVINSILSGKENGMVKVVMLISSHHGGVAYFSIMTWRRALSRTIMSLQLAGGGVRSLSPRINTYTVTDRWWSTASLSYLSVGSDSLIVYIRRYALSSKLIYCLMHKTSYFVM
jgi:hypothetical protein